MHAYRTHNCGQLRAEQVGQSVRVSGWVHRITGTDDVVPAAEDSVRQSLADGSYLSAIYPSDKGRRAGAAEAIPVRVIEYSRNDQIIGQGPNMGQVNLHSFTIRLNKPAK